MRLWPVFPVAIILIGSASTSADEMTHLFSERAAVYAADQICGFLDHDEHHALAAGYWQARGAALRATDNADAIADIDSRALIAAREMGCSHPHFRARIRHLQHAFDAFSRTRQMEYPATHSRWLSRRNVGQGWVVSQSADDDYVFGLYRDSDESEPLLAGTSRVGKTVSARLWLPEPGDLLPVSDTLYAQPRAMMHSYWASERHNGVWIFPADAADAFAALDPRAVAVIEFIGPAPSSRGVEVGDYRAATAFSRIGTTQLKP